MAQRTVIGRKVTSVQAYVTALMQLAERWKLEPAYIWYRGVSSTGHKLLPGAIWRRVIDEDSAVQNFLINYVPLVPQAASDPWELYALMQHYGMPTRLLDWTKSPLIGLYFAVENDSHARARVVWAMDPYHLNGTNYNTGVIVPRATKEVEEGVRVIDFLPKALRRDESQPLPMFPMAIEPPVSNRRILFQQGCFTVHGADARPIDRYFKGSSGRRIAQMVIPGSAVARIREQLRYLGYCEDLVYQDLQSLSRRWGR